MLSATSEKYKLIR